MKSYSTCLSLSYFTWHNPFENHSAAAHVSPYCWAVALGRTGHSFFTRSPSNWSFQSGTVTNKATTYQPHKDTHFHFSWVNTNTQEWNVRHDYIGGLLQVLLSDYDQCLQSWDFIWKINGKGSTSKLTNLMFLSPPAPNTMLGTCKWYFLGTDGDFDFCK